MGVFCFGWKWKWARVGTYRESDGAGVGGEILLDRTGDAELVAGSDHPESHRRIAADPAVNLVVLVLY